SRYTELKSVVAPFGLLVARFFALFADYSFEPLQLTEDLDPKLVLFVKGLWGAASARDQIGGLISLGLLFSIFIVFLILLCMRVTASFKNRQHSAFKVDFFSLFFSILLSYPVIYVLDRANYVIIAFIFLYLYIYSRHQNDWLPSFALAAAISVKPHLLVYLIALTDGPNRKGLSRTLICLAFSNLCSCVILWDYAFISSFVNNYTSFAGFFLPALKVFNSSNMFSVIYITFRGVLSPGAMRSIETAYGLLSMVGVVVLSFYVRNKTSELNLRLFYITILLIILPIASFDYNLILLLLFLPHLLSAPQRSFGLFDAVLLALALVPKHYLTISLEPYFPFWSRSSTYLRLTEQSVVTPLLLMALFITGLVRASRQKRTMTEAETVISKNQPLTYDVTESYLT
ncbi:MAG: hypothetical protein ABSC55_10140, partial [Syntrophorhabdales bacterium]